MKVVRRALSRYSFESINEHVVICCQFTVHCVTKVEAELLRFVQATICEVQNLKGVMAEEKAEWNLNIGTW
jgi:hypothetical protein